MYNPLASNDTCEILRRMTDKNILPSERTIMGKSEIIVPLQYYKMDYSHTYIFIPKAFEDRVDEVLHCVFGEQVEAYMIYIVNCTSDTHSNLYRVVCCSKE